MREPKRNWKADYLVSSRDARELASSLGQMRVEAGQMRAEIAGLRAKSQDGTNSAALFRLAESAIAVSVALARALEAERT